MADLYVQAARIVENVLQKKGAPKSLVLENSKIRNKKKLYALVCESIKYKSVTDQLLESSRLLHLEKKLSYSMALVLVYDFLFGHGLQVGGHLKHFMTRNKTSLQAALARMKMKSNVVHHRDLLPSNIQKQQGIHIPRYVRVNTLKTSVDEVTSYFSQKGFKMVVKGDDLCKMTSNSFTLDRHIPNLLIFPSTTDLHDNSLYIDGKIVFQDKASCFPAFVLNPPSGSHVIDACSAPGNKTSHLAAIMDNKGKIFAFDIFEKRISTMKRMLTRSGVSMVVTKQADFLKVNPNNPMYTNVHYILVDPSCSGSGMIQRLDYATCNQIEMDEKEKKRILLLARFQIKVLSHALRFPNVKNVVYSTCSLYEEENEEVVKEVLGRFEDKFQLDVALPEWPHRGRSLFPEAWKCVRASPQEGFTNGFFLALFVVKGSQKASEKAEKIRKDLNEGECTWRKEDETNVFQNGMNSHTRIEKVNNTNSTTAKRKRKREDSSNVSDKDSKTNCLYQKNWKLKYLQMNVKNQSDGTFMKKKRKTKNETNSKWWHVLKGDLRKCSSAEFDKQRAKILKRAHKRKRLDTNTNQES